ncbi:BON1-associated protein 2-like [Juglans microcarpa x Juglans regia]|uniref:BON1-associated protein 2-like n=1 Tax=Juglans microcarpa x Juglans regia TaxID=2249226 RepID=UPI001B7ED457|nr:BON1-associated protein 2-like [Juglans microcarpa x Juglans regia]XP_040988496.1 BON1-associated protein 2-like [Juglans microcarpa x Juglans regia]
MSKQNPPPFILEITVLSAEGLETTSSSTLFSRRIKPFVTFTTVPPSPFSPNKSGNKKCHVFKTRVDDEGGTNPTWGDKFRVPLDTAFFANRFSAIYLHLFTKGLIVGQVLLGWFHIPVNDLVSPPVGSVRYLSYRLRARDGSRCQGIVNLSIKLETLASVAGQRVPGSGSPMVDMCRTVIGIPATLFRHVQVRVSE